MIGNPITVLEDLVGILQDAANTIITSDTTASSSIFFHSEHLLTGKVHYDSAVSNNDTERKELEEAITTEFIRRLRMNFPGIDFPDDLSVEIDETIH